MNQAWVRHEVKYHVNAATLTNFRSYTERMLRADPYSKPGVGYDNYSIYFDSPRLRYYREKEEGLEIRTKPRLRVYKRPEDHAPLARYFEFKHRRGMMVAKERTAISEGMAMRILDPHLHDRALFGSTDSVLQKLWYLNRRYDLKPVVCVLYRREAFTCPYFPGVRITFDRLLTASSRITLDTAPSQFQAILPSNETVIEVKFNSNMPTWLVHTAQRLELKRVSLSKYVTAIQTPALGWPKELLQE